MSIWSDMEDRSAGITKRKEDEIEIPTIPDVCSCIFHGVVDSITNLPQNAQQGSVYVIKDTNQIVIFNNNIWTPIEYWYLFNNYKKYLKK